MMTEEKAQMLAKVKTQAIRFAWDNYADKDMILPKFELYAKHGKKLYSHNSVVYTLVNFDTTFEQDLERIYTLRKMGYWAYVMIYNKANCDPMYNKLARWVNNRFVFAKCERFEDYEKNVL